MLPLVLKLSVRNGNSYVVTTTPPPQQVGTCKLKMNNFIYNNYEHITTCYYRLLLNTHALLRFNGCRECVCVQHSCVK